jgi:hypothetical protein
MTPPNSDALRQRQRPPSSSPVNLSSTLSPIQNNHPSPAYQKGPPSSGGPSTTAHQQLHQKMSNSPSPSIGRGWADRFAEVLLGDDEARPESKYALICIKCFAHNGLVRQEELDHIRTSSSLSLFFLFFFAGMQPHFFILSYLTRIPLSQMRHF